MLAPSDTVGEGTIRLRHPINLFGTHIGGAAGEAAERRVKCLCTMTERVPNFQAVMPLSLFGPPQCLSAVEAIAGTLV